MPLAACGRMMERCVLKKLPLVLPFVFRMEPPKPKSRFYVLSTVFPCLCCWWYALDIERLPLLVLCDNCRPMPCRLVFLTLSA